MDWLQECPTEAFLYLPNLPWPQLYQKGSLFPGKPTVARPRASECDLFCNPGEACASGRWISLGKPLLTMTWMGPWEPPHFSALLG